MGSDEITNAAADEAVEPIESEQSPVEATQPEAEPATKQSLSRRSFFQAAALGAAATAFLEGKRFVPSFALAHVVSGANCRANDVRITGVARIINEQCNCSGTFTAQVQVPILNNTGTDRYCVTLHLCDGKNAQGDVVYTARDVILGTVGPGTTNVTFELPNYPCGAGEVCFGTFVEDGRTSCPSGCCTVISWETRPTAIGDCPQNADPTPSKCRIQQVCILSRGAVLTCVSGNNCAPACGGQVTLRLCGTGGTTPYTLRLHRVDSSGNNIGNPIEPTSTSGNCADFLVTVNETTRFRGTVTDQTGCAQQSSQLTVTVSPPTVSLGLASTLPTAACNTGTGISFRATPSACSGAATYAWSVDGTLKSETSNTFAYPNDPDGECHTVSVTVTCGGCTSLPATTTITQCINSQLGTAGSSCPEEE